MDDALRAVPTHIHDLFDAAVASGAGGNKLTDRTPQHELLASEVQQWAEERGLLTDQAALLGTYFVRRAKDISVRDVAWRSMGDQERRLLCATVRQVQATADVCIAAYASRAVQILHSGRFVTQFESATSAGLLDLDMRRIGEAATHGVAFGLDAERRAVYGYLATPGQIGQLAVTGYGGVRFVLDASVRERTTFTIGDSLNWHAAPIPMLGDITERMASDAVGRRPPRDNGQWLLDKGIDGFQSMSYFEVQVHGGVSTKHVERIEFAYPRSLTAAADREPIEDAARARGIPCRYPAEPGERAE